MSHKVKLEALYNYGGDSTTVKPPFLGIGNIGSHL